MAFSISSSGSADIAEGEAARAKSRSAAGPVTSSFVRALMIVETRILKGSTTSSSAMADTGGRPNGSSSRSSRRMTAWMSLSFIGNRH